MANENDNHDSQKQQDGVKEKVTEVIKNTKESLENISHTVEDTVKKISKKWKIFRRILATFFLILSIAVVIGYHMLMNVPYVKNLIITNFNKVSNGKLTFKLKQASVFRGFILENIKITSGPDFDHKPMVDIKKFSILYNIYGFFSGEFGVHEVGIYQPKISLIQKNNVWNFATLMKPGDGKIKEEIEEEEKKEKKVDDGKPGLSEISLPVSLRIFLKFVLEDFALSVDGLDKSNKNPIEVGLKNFTFRTHILTKKFDTIPLGIEAVELIDTFLIQLNPQKTFDLYFKNKEFETKMAFSNHWLLAFDGTRNDYRFFSRMKIGKDKIPIRYKGHKKLPLNFLIDYDLNFDPLKDMLTLDHFYVQFQHDKLFNLTGKITDASKKDKMKMDITLDKSMINLNKVYPLLKTFVPKAVYGKYFGGSISLAPLTIKGSLNDLKIDGAVKLKNIKFRQPGTYATIPYFNLSYDILVNLGKKGIAPIEYAEVGWKANVNGGRFNAKIYFAPQKKVDVGIYLTGLNPRYLAGGMARGLFNMAFTVRGRSANHITAKLNLNSKSFRYYLDRGKSGLNRMNFDFQAKVDSPNSKFKYIKVNVPKINFDLKNYETAKAVWLYSNANVNMRPGNMAVSYTMKNVGANIINLIPSLTGKLRESMEGLKETLKQDLSISGETNINIKGKTIKLNHDTFAKVPDFGINDLHIHANLKVIPKYIKINKISVTGLNKALSLIVDGSLKEGYHKAFDKNNNDKLVTVKAMIPRFNVALNFGKKVKEAIFQDHQIQGDIGLNVKLNDNIAQGSIKIKDFYYDNSQGLNVNKINMNFPFRHNLIFNKPLNLNAANKEKIIKNYSFKKPFNFTIKSVMIPHPTDKTKGKQFKILTDNKRYNAFSAYMEYKDNVFKLPIMQIFLLNGNITGQDILFNLGRGRAKEMQFAAQIQIKDIDLLPMMPLRAREGIKDASMRIDIGLQGILYDAINNMKGYASIYKIGEEFGLSGLKVAMPDSNPIVDWVVNNSIVVKKINLDISEGLVYAKILLKNKLFGNVISVADEKIAQNRIPIAQFLSRAQKESKKYQVEK